MALKREFGLAISAAACRSDRKTGAVANFRAEVLESLPLISIMRIILWYTLRVTPSIKRQ